MSDDAECNLTARIKSYAKGEFVHIVFKNTSNAILFPYEYTKKDVGIKYAFYDMQGELADDIVSKTIDCIILPNEEVNLTIPVTINTPHKEGNYLLKMWIYEDDEDGSVLLEKKIKVSRRI